jgi:hypothetical protein
MKIDHVNINGVSIAVIESDEIVINTVQDALDLMANCDYQGSRKIIIEEKNIIPVFFDLRTGIAGEILQKFSTYNVSLAIAGSFTKYTSKNFKDFVYESNKMGKILFVNSIDVAKEKLAANGK